MSRVETTLATVISVLLFGVLLWIGTRGAFATVGAGAARTSVAADEAPSSVVPMPDASATDAPSHGASTGKDAATDAPPEGGVDEDARVVDLLEVFAADNGRAGGPHRAAWARAVGLTWPVLCEPSGLATTMFERFEAETSGSGRLRRSRDPDECPCILVTDGVAAALSCVDVPTPISASREPVTLGPARRLRLRLVAPWGVSLSDARVAMLVYGRFDLHWVEADVAGGSAEFVPVPEDAFLASRSLFVVADGVYAGPYDVPATPPGGGVPELDLLSTRSVKGRVVGPDGPVAAAQVRGEHESNVVAQSHATTDEDGAFVLQGVPARLDEHVVVVAKGLASDVFRVRAAHDHVDVGALHLERGVLVHGTVTVGEGGDPTGAPQPLEEIARGYVGVNLVGERLASVHIGTAHGRATDAATSDAAVETPGVPVAEFTVGPVPAGRAYEVVCHVHETTSATGERVVGRLSAAVAGVVTSEPVRLRVRRGARVRLAWSEGDRPATTQATVRLTSESGRVHRHHVFSERPFTTIALGDPTPGWFDVSVHTESATGTGRIYVDRRCRGDAQVRLSPD